MVSVTVPGPHSSTIGQIFGNANNAAIAQQIANAINAADAAGRLIVETPLGNSGNVRQPPTNPGGINELVISKGGDYTIPPGSSNAPDYVVILDNTDPVTIHGAPNSTVWGGGGGQVTVIDPATITLSEGASRPVVNLIGSGDMLAGNNNAATVTASGNNDTIFAGGGRTDVTTSGSNGFVAGSTLLGAAGGLNVLDTGTGDTIAPGSASAAVTLDGSGALVSGALGPVSVLDNGTSDTINASSSLTTITAPGGSFVNGGSGSLNFVGGAGPSTILGGSGDSTVFGGTGLTSLVGGAGGAVTYVNTTAGALFFGGRNGDETVDASLSRGTNTLYGALDATGRNLLIGGAGDDFINAGSGADTLVGGGGENEFFFWSNFGGPSANHTIGDFSAIDTVVLANYSPGEAAAAIAGATTSGGSTTITLSDNTKITFTGVISPAALIGHIVS